jgi:hypothetical protein
MSNGTAEIKSGHLKTWALNFLKISSPYKSDTNAMNIDILLFAAWLALQPWRIGRMFFEKFGILIFPHLHLFSLCIHELAHASVSLKVREASSQTLYMERMNSNMKQIFFRSVQILRELTRITTFATA